MWQFVIGPKPFWYWLLTALFGVAALAIYLVNDRERKDIRWSIAQAQAVGCPTSFKEPERWGFIYDAAMLNAFRDCAAKAPLRSHVISCAGQKTALERYIRPVLISNDIYYALCLGVFAGLFAGCMVRALPALLSLLLSVGPAASACVAPYLAPVMVVAAINGLLYFGFDVAEDRRLAALMMQREPIGTEQALEVRLLSGVKLVAVGLSIWGALGHGIFGLIGDRVNGPDPARAGLPRPSP